MFEIIVVLVGIAQVDVGRGIRRVDFYRLLKHGNGLFIRPQILRQAAQVVQRQYVIRLLRSVSSKALTAACI
jgi:hypothetical protein